MKKATVVLTSIHYLIQSWEALVNSCADGAENKNWGEVGVSHECSTQQTTPLIRAVDVPRHHHHQVVRQRKAGVLTPPAIKGHGHIEAWSKTIGIITTRLQMWRTYEQSQETQTHPAQTKLGWSWCWWTDRSKGQCAQTDLSGLLWAWTCEENKTFTWQMFHHTVELKGKIIYL